METLQALVVQIWARTETKFIVGHVLLNLVIALSRVVSSGTFNLRKLSGFLTDKLLPYLGVFAVAVQFENAIGFPGLGIAAWGLIQANLAAQTLDSLGKLGVPIPLGLMNMVREQPMYVEPDKAFDAVYAADLSYLKEQESEKEQAGD